MGRAHWPLVLEAETVLIRVSALPDYVVVTLPGLIPSSSNLVWSTWENTKIVVQKAPVPPSFFAALHGNKVIAHGNFWSKDDAKCTKTLKSLWFFSQPECSKLKPGKNPGWKGWQLCAGTCAAWFEKGRERNGLFYRPRLSALFGSHLKKWKEFDSHCRWFMRCITWSSAVLLRSMN